MFNQSQQFEYPHRRYNPLSGEWILVSPHRTKRPWQGQVEKLPPQHLPEYDAECYLCPGNVRANGEKNPDYSHTFAFTNDFSALLPTTNNERINKSNILIAHDEQGICRVVCFSPRHNLTLAEMELSGIRKIVDVWCEEYNSLGTESFINYVQIFENRGEMMGCSNPHPHCQIWAESSIPTEPAKELKNQLVYLEEHGSCLLCLYVRTEMEYRERLICSNEHFLAVVPFWANWPFETMILSVHHKSHLLEFSEEERDAFADIMKQIVTRYDNLFKIPFPYSSGIHQAPTDGALHPECHFHMHFYPPLLRSATIKKFMVGYEILANPQRDITPELSAERLRNLPTIHYKEAGKNQQ